MNCLHVAGRIVHYNERLEDMLKDLLQTKDL